MEFLFCFACSKLIILTSKKPSHCQNSMAFSCLDFFSHSPGFPEPVEILLNFLFILLDNWLKFEIWQVTFLAHLSIYADEWAYSLGRPPSLSVRRWSVGIVHHFQTSSQKPPGQSKPNFMWNLNGMEEWKFIQMILIIWPRWLPCPYTYMIKNLQISSPKAADWWPLDEHGIQHQGLRPHKVCSNDDPGLALTFLQQGQLCSIILLYGKMRKYMY